MVCEINGDSQNKLYLNCNVHTLWIVGGGGGIQVLALPGVTPPEPELEGGDEGEVLRGHRGEGEDVNDEEDVDGGVVADGRGWDVHLVVPGLLHRGTQGLVTLVGTVHAEVTPLIDTGHSAV